MGKEVWTVGIEVRLSSSVTVATGALDDPTVDIEVDLAEITDGKLPPLTGYQTRSDQRFSHGNDEGAPQHLH